MQCRLKGTDPVYSLFANVVVCPEEITQDHLIAYVTMKNCIQQLYHLALARVR